MRPLALAAEKKIIKTIGIRRIRCATVLYMFLALCYTFQVSVVPFNFVKATVIHYRDCNKIHKSINIHQKIYVGQ